MGHPPFHRVRRGWGTRPQPLPGLGGTPIPGAGPLVGMGICTLGENSGMRFGNPRLKAYAQPVSASELREGRVYFAVQFVDQNMLIPVMETLVFVGQFKSGPKQYARFQTIDSYNAGVQYDAATEEEMASFLT